MARLSTFLAKLVLALALPGVARAADLKLGVVDVKRVMDSVPAWNQVVDKLRKEWEKKQSTLQAEQDVLRKKKDELDEKRVVADPEAIAKEEAQLVEGAQRLAATFIQQQRIISAQEMDLKDQMLKRINPLVYALAEAQEFDLVFESGTEAAPNVLFAARPADLTDAVIKAYKKEFKDKGFTVREPKLPPEGAAGLGEP